MTFRMHRLENLRTIAVRLFPQTIQETATSMYRPDCGPLCAASAN